MHEHVGVHEQTTSPDALATRLRASAGPQRQGVRTTMTSSAPGAAARASRQRSSVCGASVAGTITETVVTWGQSAEEGGEGRRWKKRSSLHGDRTNRVGPRPHPAGWFGGTLSP